MSNENSYYFCKQFKLIINTIKMKKSLILASIFGALALVACNSNTEKVEETPEEMTEQVNESMEEANENLDAAMDTAAAAMDAATQATEEATH